MGIEHTQDSAVKNVTGWGGGIRISKAENDLSHTTVYSPDSLEKRLKIFILYDSEVQ